MARRPHFAYGFGNSATLRPQAYGLAHSARAIDIGGRSHSPTATLPLPPALRRPPRHVLSHGMNGNVDSVPAMLTPGEAVLNVGAKKLLGAGRINKLNARGLRGYEEGTSDVQVEGPAGPIKEKPSKGRDRERLRRSEEGMDEGIIRDVPDFDAGHEPVYLEGGGVVPSLGNIGYVTMEEQDPRWADIQLRAPGINVAQLKQRATASGISPGTIQSIMSLFKPGGQGTYSGGGRGGSSVLDTSVPEAWQWNAVQGYQYGTGDVQALDDIFARGRVDPYDYISSGGFQPAGMLGDYRPMQSGASVPTVASPVAGQSPIDIGSTGIYGGGRGLAPQAYDFGMTFGGRGMIPQANYSAPPTNAPYGYDSWGNALAGPASGYNAPTLTNPGGVTIGAGFHGNEPMNFGDFLEANARKTGQAASGFTGARIR